MKHSSEPFPQDPRFQSGGQLAVAAGAAQRLGSAGPARSRTVPPTGVGGSPAPIALRAHTDARMRTTVFTNTQIHLYTHNTDNTHTTQTIHTKQTHTHTHTHSFFLFTEYSFSKG